MSDINVRVEGKAGRITLLRPEALNALTHEMTLAIDTALIKWRDDPAVHIVLIDAAGDKAFCAGGDIARLYETGRAGDFSYGHDFWRDEYRMNARIAEYPKPVVTLMQGFTMGGGVGLGCHAACRVVGMSSRIAMPECAIGLVPDVGGSLILARLEARIPGFGAWLGATGVRLNASDACMTGFADRFEPEDSWETLLAGMIETGTAPAGVANSGDPGIAQDMIECMSHHFTRDTPAEIVRSLGADDSEAAQAATKALTRNSPLSVACHLEMLRRIDPEAGLRDALALEYRYTCRSMEHGDFLEGIRAQIIDKDRNPKWRHARVADVTPTEVDAMLAPLGDGELNFYDERGEI